MRRVLLLIIDSLNPEALRECLNKDTVPAMAFLAKNGLLSNAVATFPTMTPVALASIATGFHCDVHHVPGFIWYDTKNARYVNYGASLRSILTFGPARAFKELFYNLNDKHLNPAVKTIYEELYEQGVASACINFFIRRGGKKILPNFHWLMKIFQAFGLERRLIAGPDILIWGEVANPGDKVYRGFPRGIFNKFGVNDHFSAEATCQLIRDKTLPQFTLTYFPDNDRYSHVHGPRSSHASIEAVDKGIGRILSAFGSWEEALRENHIIVTGDHTQSFIGRHNIVKLDKLLQNFRLAPGKFSFGRNPQLVVSANERMTIIDILDCELAISQVVSKLKTEQNIGLIMWKADNAYHTYNEGKELSFFKEGPLQDRYGVSWGYKGDLAAVGGHLKDTRINFGVYPDAFERIAAALDYGTEAKILLSATVGWEYSMPGAPIHPGGGSHGSLHSSDSVVPIISAGLDTVFTGKRLIDIKEHVLKFFTKNRD